MREIRVAVMREDDSIDPRGSARDTGMIEVEAGGLTVRIARGADVRAVAAVIAALKSAR